MARFVFFIISLFIQMSITFDFCVIYERAFNERKIFVFQHYLHDSCFATLRFYTTHIVYYCQI